MRTLHSHLQKSGGVGVDGRVVGKQEVTPFLPPGHSLASLRFPPGASQLNDQVLRVLGHDLATYVPSNLRTITFSVRCFFSALSYSTSNLKEPDFLVFIEFSLDPRVGALRVTTLWKANAVSFCRYEKPSDSLCHIRPVVGSLALTRARTECR